MRLVYDLGVATTPSPRWQLRMEQWRIGDGFEAWYLSAAHHEFRFHIYHAIQGSS
jgi:hypothetical protein